MAIGYVYTTTVLPIFVVFGILAVVLDHSPADNQGVLQQAAIVGAPLLLFEGLTYWATSRVGTLNRLVEVLVSLAVFALIFRSSGRREAFFKAFFEVLALLCLSSIITFLLQRFAPGLAFELGELTSDRESTEYRRTVLFPLSLRWEFAGVSAELDRFSHMFNEPGMAPGFLCSGGLWAWPRKRWFLMALYAVGLVLTSSTGVALVVGVVVVTLILLHPGYRFPARVAVATVAAALAAGAFFFTPNFGYLDKQSSHGESFEERTGWYDSLTDLDSWSADGFRDNTLMLGLLVTALGFVAKRNKRAYAQTMSGLAANSMLNWIQLTPMYSAFLLYDPPIETETQRRD